MARAARARRAMIVAAAGLTAGLAALASALLPGRSLGAGTHRRAALATPSRPVTSAPQLPAPAGAAQLGLQAPSQAPSTPTPSGPAAPASSPAPAASAPAPAASAPAIAPAPVPAPAPVAPAVSGGS